MSLVIDNIVKRFGGREVLKGLSLTCEHGEHVAIVGPNGTGKSTLLGVVAGIIEPESGGVTLDSEPLLGRSVQARGAIGYVPEGADPPSHLLTRELLDLCAALKRAAPLAPDIIERLGVSPLLDQPIGSLSLGQRRRACLAAALVGAPTLLLLDEPTNGLDPGGIEMLAALLLEHQARGGIALVSTHDLIFADAIRARRAPIAGGRIVSQ
jgi:ABC-type multidrug transport system ATPase subunit